MKNKRKGFTLVELLVVIAILAVLASVSVVGYLSFTNKAKESNDISLTKQMNTILQGETATEGANKVAHDAVLDLQENGLDVTKLTPTSEGYEFVWDLTQDKFFLLDKTGKQVAPQGDTLSTNKTDIFKFVGKDGTLSNEYSNYLKNDYVSTGTETISTGFDAGENTTVTTLNYNNTTARTATIRTNGGTLQVTAPNDTVHHYGNANIVDVISVDANNSYHEFGNVGTIKAASGRIVVEDSITTSVSSVLVQTPKQGNPNDGVKVHINKVQDSKVTVSKEVGANVTELKDGDVTVDTNTLKTGVQVATYDELKAALNDVNNKSIYITDNIDITTMDINNNNNNNVQVGITVNRSVELYGGKHYLTYNGTLTSDARMIDIVHSKNTNVLISDLNVSTKNYGQYLRGINFGALENVEVTLNNVNVTLPHYYALNIHQSCKNVKLNMNDCTIKAWNTIYNHASGTNLTATNCTLIGINPEAKGQDNSFSTIVVADYYGLPNGNISRDNKLTFNNCRLTCEKVNPGALEVNQYIVDVRNPANNNVYFNNCQFEHVHTPQFIKVCWDTSYANKEWRNQNRNNSHVYFDDREVTYNIEMTHFYFDGTPEEGIVVPTKPNGK